MTHQPEVPEHYGQQPPQQAGYPLPQHNGYQQYSQHPHPYQHPGGPFLPQKPPVSGLRVAAGILGILTTFWAVILSIGIGSVFVAASVVFGLVALSLLTLGIIQIVKARSRDSGLPLALLGVTGVGIVGAIAAAAFRLTGGAFVFVAIAMFLPVAVLSLLAFLQARTARRDQGQPGAHRPR